MALFNTPEIPSLPYASLDTFIHSQSMFFDSFSESVLITDTSLKVLWANKAALLESGLPLEAARGKVCHEFLHGSLIPCDTCHVLKTLDDGLVSSCTITNADRTNRDVRHIPIVIDNCIAGLVEIVLSSPIQQASCATFYNQFRLNSIRAEIWKKSADKSLSKEELIKNLLGILGEFLDVSRASFFEQAEDQEFPECKVQWCAGTMPVYIGQKLPISLRNPPPKQKQSDVIILTKHDFPVGSSPANYFDEFGIKSLLSITFSQNPHSIFSFTDCKTERHWNDHEINLVLEMTKVVAMRADQIRTEQEKRTLEFQLQHAQTLEAIGQLAGGIAHDFNNILGAISGYAEMIRQKFSADNPKIEKYSTAILSGARKGADLTSQLLAFARRGRFDKSSIDVHVLLSRTALILQHSLDQSIQVVLECQASEPHIVGDTTQLQNILLNLAMNSKDAMPNGGTLTIKTSNGDIPDYLKKTTPDACEGPYIIISVTDTGIGMNEQVRSKLFEPFFTTKEIGKGTGLGLASVYGSVKSHQGLVSVQSEVGRGSIITIYLPVDKNAMPVQPALQAHESIPGKGNIMLIDNDDSIRALCREMLTLLGYSIVEFSNGPQAVHYYRDNMHTIDLVITDMIMEEQSGMDCFKELKKLNSSVKAVLSSGYSFEAERAEMEAIGICGMIQKPFDSITLSHIVAKALIGP